MPGNPAVYPICTDQDFVGNKVGFALEVQARPQPDNHTIRIDFGAANWGYGWQFPKSGAVTIGVGGLQKKNPDLAQSLTAYMNMLGEPELKVKGHHLPFGHFLKSPGRGNILLCGDAAGLVDPITGEGIAHALFSGAAAAEVAAKASTPGANINTTREYQARLTDIHKSLRIARALRTLIFAAPFQNLAARSLAGSGSLRATYLGLLAGDLEYPTFLRRVATRLPSLLKQTVFPKRPML